MTQFCLNYSPVEVCRHIVAEHLHAMDIAFTLNDSDELLVLGAISVEEKVQIDKALHKYGISLLQLNSENIVDAIKNAIENLLNSPDTRTEKVSTYLSDTLGYSYSYLSNRFSDETFTSIENFIILRRIEHVKKLMLQGENSLTEIAGKLDYSSVAHLSGQFKKMTGLTPTGFLRIIQKRNNARKG